MDFDIVLSFGPICRTKYQLLRTFGKDECPSSVFDWQRTPMSAIRFYLENDFRGTFEREDLEVSGYSVINRKLRTSHLHAFPKHIADDEIDRYYSRARARHDHLCDRTRAILRGDRRVLICVGAHLRPYRWMRLNFVIRRYAPKLRFRLLNGPANDCSHEIWKGDDALWDRHLAHFL
jgi:hypothetical protein